MRGNSNCYTCWAVIFNHLLACMGIKTAEKILIRCPINAHCNIECPYYRRPR